MDTIRKYLPLLAVLLLYFGGLAPRPLFAPDEFRHAAAAVDAIDSPLCRPAESAGAGRFDCLAGRLLAATAPQTGWLLRLLPALATLLTGGALYLAGRRRSAALGRNSALIYLGTLLVFAAGTAVTVLPLFVLGGTAAVLGAAALTGRGRPEWRDGALLLAGLAVMGLFAEALEAPDFRRPTMVIWAAVGLLPAVLFLPVVIAGLRGVPKRDPSLQAAGAGVLFALLLGVFNPVLAVLQALPFLAIFAAYGFNRYAEIDGAGVRLNRLLRRTVMLFVGLAIALLVLHMLIRGGKVSQEYLLYGQFSHFLFAVFALIILLVWLLWALKLPDCRRKLGGILLGFGFLFFAGQHLTPSRLLSRHALEVPLRLFFGTDVTPETVVYADREFADVAAWTLRPAGGVIESEAGDAVSHYLARPRAAGEAPRHWIVLRRGLAEPAGPPPSRKLYYYPADLSILEYGP